SNASVPEGGNETPPQAAKVQQVAERDHHEVTVQRSLSGTVAIRSAEVVAQRVGDRLLDEVGIVRRVLRGQPPPQALGEMVEEINRRKRMAVEQAIAERPLEITAVDAVSGTAHPCQRTARDAANSRMRCAYPINFVGIAHPTVWRSRPTLRTAGRP